MAKLKGKGCKLQQKIASTLTDVAQIISITLPEAEVKTYSSEALDSGAGVPYDPTGQTEGGSCSAELFLDPALAGHKAITALLTTPAKNDWAVVFSNGAATTWLFTGAGIKFGGGTISLNEGVKAKLEIKLDGIVTYPT